MKHPHNTCIVSLSFKLSRLIKQHKAYNEPFLNIIEENILNIICKHLNKTDILSLALTHPLIDKIMFPKGSTLLQFDILKLKNDPFNNRLYERLIQIAPNLTEIEVKNIVMKDFWKKISKFEKLIKISISLHPHQDLEPYPLSAEELKIMDYSSDPNLLISTMRNFGNLSNLTLKNSIITERVISELVQYMLEELHLFNCIENFSMERLTYRFLQFIFTSLKKLSIIDHWSPESLKFITVFKHMNTSEFKLRELNISQSPYDDYFFCDLPQLETVTVILRNSQIPISKFISSFSDATAVIIKVNRNYDPFHKQWFEIVGDIIKHRETTIILQEE